MGKSMIARKLNKQRVADNVGGDMVDEDVWYICGEYCIGGIRFNKCDYLMGKMSRHGPTQILAMPYKRLSIMVNDLEYITDMTTVMEKGTYEGDFIRLPYRFFQKRAIYWTCVE